MAELEGFLCPLCKADLRSLQELEKHYREEHKESRSGASKFINNFKNLVDIAKTSLKIDTSPKPGARERTTDRGEVLEGSSSQSVERSLSQSVEGPVTNVSGISTELWEPQQMGFAGNHTFDFRRLRDVHFSERVVETNRLIIRVEKLFRLVKERSPKNAKEMRSLEQSVVPWRQDENEKHCERCGRKFGVRRRRHHCRFCGCIMCKDCSLFITLVETYPVLSDSPDFRKLAPPSPAPRKKKLFKKDQDVEDEESEGRDDIRTCSQCRSLLQRRLDRVKGLQQAEYVLQYKRMKDKMEESERLKPPFMKVAEQLWSGENVGGLKAATMQRQELLQVYEVVDSISKKILGTGSSSRSSSVQKLSRYVRVFASSYLQDNLLCLPTVPTLDQFKKIKEEKEREAELRVREIERQREEQRQLNLKKEKELAERLSHEVDSGIGKISSELDSGLGKLSAGVGKFTAEMDKLLKKDRSGAGMSGWVGEGSGQGGWMCAPEMVVRDADEDKTDPFLLQKEQLISYIAQARDAHRMDEVRTLEQSLRDIEQVIRDRKRSFGTSY